MGAVTGAALPLLDLTGVAGGVAPWGYLALLVAVACVAVDRYFGVTSGWMRDVATAQAVQRRLQALQFDWASESVREVLGPAEGTAGEAAERCLGVLRRFSEDLTELVRAETADWMVEFRSGVPRRRGCSRWCARGGGRARGGGERGGSVPPPQRGAGRTCLGSGRRSRGEPDAVPVCSAFVLGRVRSRPAVAVTGVRVGRGWVSRAGAGRVPLRPVLRPGGSAARRGGRPAARSWLGRVGLQTAHSGWAAAPARAAPGGTHARSVAWTFNGSLP